MYSAETSIYQSQQIRECERQAKEKFGITGMILMERAGKAAFDFIIRRWPEIQSIALFCGGGNNGGDGYVVAKLAQENDLKVTIWQVGNQDRMTEEAKQTLADCKKAGISISVFNPRDTIPQADLIVDAICGIGLHDQLRDDVLLAVEKLSQIPSPILSIDVPTGVDADTGQVLGHAIRATATVTFIGLKLGLLTGQGIAYTGELICDDLKLPQDLFLKIPPVAKKISLSDYSSYLKPRPRDWHKGLSGHVLVIGGEFGYSGAPRMAAEAALRVGAGLVSVATHPDIANNMNITFPEMMCHGVNTEEELEPLVSKAKVLVIGPGLGQTAWSKRMWNFISTKKIPKVVDADALNLLAKNKKVSDDWILTPHPGEAARLLEQTTEQIQQDRLLSIKAITQHYGGVCVLKGAGSLVLEKNSLPLLCDKGNPGMASAGMGDVLSGIIGGLVAQGIPLAKAAALGVYIHAAAGDLAAIDGERGLVATDLMPYIRLLANYSNDQAEGESAGS